MGDIPPKWNRKEPMCFSFLSLSGSEIVERLFNKIPQMSVPRNPLPKYVAKTALRLISIGRDWQPSARLPPTRFFALGRTRESVKPSPGSNNTRQCPKGCSRGGRKQMTRR
jgi:hypothetical protein